MRSEFELRDYQVSNAQKAAAILKELNIVYLAMEVRTGKTLTALHTAELVGAENVLFLTKKKAIASIEGDYKSLNPQFNLTVINDESMHKVVDEDFDLVIHDEHHRFGGFPKPSAGAKMFKASFDKLPQIYLSGTPTPECWAQIYHQFWVSRYSPFKEATFYKWARAGYVNVTQRMLAFGPVNDYSSANWAMIKPLVEPYMVRYTQKQSGFNSVLNERAIRVPMSPLISRLTKEMMDNHVVCGKTGTISAGNAAALQQKIHQLHSGTVILDPKNEGEAGESIVLCRRKAEVLRQAFPGMKLVIFYQYKAELKAITQELGDAVTTDLAVFDNSDKSIALQIVSGREGLNLSKGQAIVFYNLSFSATSYWQARDRLTTQDRKESDVYWLFTEGGIEEKIFAAVARKKNYTTAHFKADFSVHAKRYAA